MNNVTIHLMGDSIVEQCKEKEYPRCGWGMFIGEYFKDGYSVKNHSHSGWTTQTYLTKNHDNLFPGRSAWEVIIEQVKKDDWVIISLGINDASLVNELKTDEDTYRKNLTFFTEKIREKGANVIFTTITIRGGDDGSPLGWNYTVAPEDTKEPDMDQRWMRRTQVLLEIAKDINVPVLPLGQNLISIYENMYNVYRQQNPEKSEIDARNYVRYYFHLYNKNLNAPKDEGGFGMNCPEREDDSTHLNERGAKVYAHTVAKLISRSDTKLSEYIDISKLNAFNGGLGMYQIDSEKMQKINYEQIKNPERYSGEKKMTKEVLKKALDDALLKIDKLWNDVHGNFPAEHSTDNIYPEVKNEEGWNQGFFTGMLWLAYEATGDEKYKERAFSQLDSYENRIDNHLGTNTHDMGFIYIPSCVAAYKLAGSEQGRRSAIKASDHLLTRYIKNGKFIQAWGDVGSQNRLIIDCMNNIPLLFWASELTGDNNYYEKAYNHAITTINNIVREDGSTHHTFFFNPDGTPLYGRTAQGAGDDTCWSRGQAWITSGLPQSYKYTKDPEMLKLFEKVVNYFLNRLPKDYVPFWDMSFTDGDDEPRDSASAAIASCGILEMLPNIKDEELKAIYEKAVDEMMYSLYTKYSTKDDPSSNGLLLHATYSKPGNFGVDECNIWGCYYYMEALVRLLGSTKAYW